MPWLPRGCETGAACTARANEAALFSTGPLSETVGETVGAEPFAPWPGDAGADGDMGIPASALAALAALPEGGAEVKANAAGDAIAGGSDDGGGAEPPEVCVPAAAARRRAPANDPAAMVVALPSVVATALASVIIVLPTSPRTMRLAMNGIKAMESEKRLAVRAKRIISLEPTKLFSTPFALSTASMLDRLTADIKT